MLVLRMASSYDITVTVYIDDEPVDLYGPDLGTMLQAARQRLAPMRRIVVEVELDGRRLDLSALASEQKSVLGDQSELRLVTTDSHALVLSILRQIRDELQTVRQEQTDAAELLQQDQQLQAVQYMASALDKWQQIQHAIGQATELIGIDLHTLSLGETSVDVVINGMIGQLKTLRGLLAGGDTVALADALFYEWPKTVDQWNQLLNAVIDAVNLVPKPRSEGSE